jgi:hypothetical protein
MIGVNTTLYSNLNNTISYDNNVGTLQSNLGTFSTNLKANFDIITNTDSGALYGVSCQPIT